MAHLALQRYGWVGGLLGLYLYVDFPFSFRHKINMSFFSFYTKIHQVLLNVRKASIKFPLFLGLIDKWTTEVKSKDFLNK